MKCRCGELMHRTHVNKYWCPKCGRLLLVSEYDYRREWYISEGKQAALQSLRAILAHIENEYETAKADRTIAFIKETCQKELAKEGVPLLKDASEMTGIWDFTGGVNPVEYIRGMRDEEGK